MLFNMRVRFANNIIIFYEYEKPLNDKNKYYLQDLLFERLPNYDFSFFDFAKLSKFLRESKTQFDLENMPLPYLEKFLKHFEKEEQHQISLFENDKVKDFRVLKANFNAKKDRFIDLVNANLAGNCFFVTLTYNEENKLLIDDLVLSHNRFKKFIRMLNYYTFGRDIYDLKYLTTWELQKKAYEGNNFTPRMAIHYHMLVFDFPHKKMDLELLRKIWNYGSVNVKRVNKTTSGVSKYMSKYLLKDLEDLVNHKKSYFGSRNLVKPFNDFVVSYDKENNIITLKSGVVINLNEYNIESVEDYTTVFTGKTKKITYNKS